MKTLIIDNYDSYTYNLYQLISDVNKEKAIVIKNDEMTYDEIVKLNFDNVIISPGPGRPDKIEDFGVCGEIIKKLDKPILGVCLGQQGIFHFSGGEIVKAKTPMHGRLSKINHNDKNLFKGIKQGFKATRYHSLVCKDQEIENINIDARSEDGEIMAISHKTKPIYGLQFHPESISTEFGYEMMKNFKRLTEDFYKNHSDLKYTCLDKKIKTGLLYKNLKKYDEKLIWLDSSAVIDGLSRFTIFAFRNGRRSHLIKYNVDKKIVEKTSNDGKIQEFETDIFSYLKENRLSWPYNEGLEFDFQLGYVGYLGYELKKDTISEENKHSYPYPDAYFAYVDRAAVYDHKKDKLYLLSYKDDEDFSDEIKNILDNIDENIDEAEIDDKNLPELSLVKDKEEYIGDIDAIEKLIEEGESYEVCLTNRLDIKGSIDPDKYYMLLRDASPGPYSCLINFDEISIACSSMERFIKINKDRIIETKPIKGTIRRGKDKKEDLELINALKNEEKTFSENLMIVDLLRNDLGKVCKIGSVKVPKLMDVETYSTLHQLVSTVEGEISDSYDIIDVIEATFPGGSMTGAPKKRTLEIIDELENYPRGIYSGSIGYISNNECVDFNIVIRTALIEKDKASIGVGGAIIYLSDPEEEYEEILLKAKGSLKALSSYYNKDLSDVK